MTAFRVGTSGIHYREWRGTFFPPELGDDALLPYYSQRFPTVELNYTFYKSPTVRTVQGWGKETPPSFIFCLKAPRRITHDLRLRDAADPVSDFCDLAGVLKDRLGPLFFQLPPFLKRDVPRLEDFLHQMPPDFRVAFEFRNSSWFTDEVYECLRRFNVAMCISEASERTPHWEATADFGYCRLRMPEYSESDLAERAEKIRGLAAGWTDAFIFFKHEAAAMGPVYAAQLRDLLEGSESPLLSAEG